MHTTSSFPENVKFKIDNAEYRFTDLCESAYLKQIILELQQVMAHRFQDFEFIIYSRPTYNQKTARAKVTPLADSDKKQVVLYVSDEMASVPVRLADQAFAVFKHYLPSFVSSTNIFPLPLGYNKDTGLQRIKPINNRLHNVLFVGQFSSGRTDFYKQFAGLEWVPSFLLRKSKKVLKLLKNDFSDRYPNSLIRMTRGLHQGLCPEKYTERLYESKIVLCPPSMISKETLRLFDAMRAGCIIITEKLPYHSFYVNSPILQVGSWAEVDDLIHKLLYDPELMQNIHRRMLDWWYTHCSEQAVANYIFDKIISLEQQVERTISDQHSLVYAS